jgi:hypothetical protein
MSETSVPIRMSKRARLPRSVPIRSCWSVLVHFGPDAENRLKQVAAERRVGASRLVEQVMTQYLKENHAQ